MTSHGAVWYQFTHRAWGQALRETRRWGSMDTRAAAENLGTTAKTLRRFLRSPESTFHAVGSGARYDFTSADLAAMAPRFAAWQRKGGTSTRPAPAPDVPVFTTSVDHVRLSQHARDRLVWAEEGDVEIPDIRDPRVRARVRRIARAQEARLNERLLAVGLHITQRAG